MATQAEVKVILTIDSQGNAKIQEVVGGIEKVDQAAKTAGAGYSRWAGYVENTGTSLLQVMGVTLSIAGAAYLAEKAFRGWYSLLSGGISIVDDYQKKIISTSYILTTMSKVDPPDLSKAYGQWKDYFAWLYQQSLDADKKAASSAGEIFSVSVELAKKGVVATTKEEILTIARLTDLMKAVTPGYMNFEQQARGEIQAMMEGTARMGAQTAQILSQIDPEFKKNITSAKAMGTVLEYIEGLLPRIKQYTLDLMGTWDAVGASLKSAWQVINIEAFGGAHRAIVALATELSDRLVDNGKLTEDGERAARALGQAWNVAKGYIEEAMDYVLDNSDALIGKIETAIATMGRIAGIAIDIGLGFLNTIDFITQFQMNIAVAMAQTRAHIGYTIEWFGIMGTAIKEVSLGIIYNFNEIGPAIDKAYASMESSSNRWARTATQDANEVRDAVLNSMTAGRKPSGFAFMGGEVESSASVAASGESPAPPTPDLRSPGGKEKAGKTDAAERKIENLVNTIMGEIARLSEGDLGNILGWANKSITEIERVGAAYTEYEEAKSLLAQATNLKIGKVQQEFSDWFAGHIHNDYAKLDAETDKVLRKFATLPQKMLASLPPGLAAQIDLGQLTAWVEKAKEAAGWMKDLQTWRLDNKMWEAEVNLQKKYADGLAAASPLLIQQLGWKKESLELELALGKAKLEQVLYENSLLPPEKQMSLELKDQLRARQALLEVMKRSALEREGWETQGIAGGIQIFAMDLRKEAESALALGVVAGLKGAKGYADNAITDLIMSPFTKKKMDFKKIGLDIATSIASGFVKMQTTRLFSFFADGAIGMVQTWTTAQKAMTGASLAGDAARAASTAAGASQSIGILSALANITILKQAGQAAAGGFKSVMVSVPFPLNVILAPIVAAAAFAATIAFGSGGGGGGGGGGGAGTTNPSGGYSEGYHSGGIVAHQGLIVAHDGLNLAPNERNAVLLVDEWVLKPDAAARLQAQGGPDTFNRLNSGQLPYLPVPVGGGSGGGGTVNNYQFSMPVNQQVLQRLDYSELRRTARDNVRATEREMRRLGRG